MLDWWEWLVKSAKVHIQVCGLLKKQQNQGSQDLNVHTTQILVH